MALGKSNKNERVSPQTPRVIVGETSAELLEKTNYTLEMLVRLQIILLLHHGVDAKTLESSCPGLEIQA